MALIQSFSGIRGIFDKDLTEQVALKYAYSYFHFLKEKSKKNNLKIVIGTDTRPSGKELKNAVIEALNCTIIDLGIASTPAVEFAVRHYKADGGIIITASHNEPYWNGFKFLGKDGAVLRERDIDKVIQFYNKIKDISDEVFSKDFLYKNIKKLKVKKIIEKHKEINNLYSEFVLSFLNKKDIQNIKNSKLKIIIDHNGDTGIIAKKNLEKIGVEVIALNMEHGIFNRTIEPTLTSLVYLKSNINENKASFAAAFDCDADRAEFVLPSGRLLSGHYSLALIIDNFSKKNNEDKTIVVNDATSNIVRYIVEKNNLKLKEVSVGEINIVDEMHKSDCKIGGEGSSSGVIIRPSRCRDGIVTLLLILKIIAEKKKPLQDIMKEYPQYYTLEAKVPFEQKNHDKIKKFLRNYYSKKGYNVKEINGIKGSLKVIINNDKFVWFRASKTEEDIFRVMADSKSSGESQKLLDEGKNCLKIFESK